MLRIIAVIILFSFSIGAHAETLTDEKKQVIDELLKITGALQIAEIMGTTVANQMISAMAEQNENMAPEVIEIIQDEIGSIMRDEFIENRWIHEMSYSLYHQYLSMAELKELVAFYKTPVGTKVVSVLPQITQEGMLAGQTHGESLGPIIQERLVARFQREGLL